MVLWGGRHGTARPVTDARCSEIYTRRPLSIVSKPPQSHTLLKMHNFIFSKYHLGFMGSHSANTMLCIIDMGPSLFIIIKWMTHFNLFFFLYSFGGISVYLFCLVPHRFVYTYILIFWHLALSSNIRHRFFLLELEVSKYIHCDVVCIPEIDLTHLSYTRVDVRILANLVVYTRVGCGR